jgi:hypothetical protein
VTFKLWKEFEQLIFDIRNNKIEVEIFLAPYAPSVYDKIENEYPVILDTERKLNECAKNNKLKYRGHIIPINLT